MTDDFRQNALPALERALEHAKRQCRRIVTAYPHVAPMYTEHGRWAHQGESWTHWCEGFFPGILWLLFAKSKDRWFSEAAQQYTVRLENRRWDESVHDLGFLFLNTYRRWNRLDPTPERRQIVVDAGRTLAKRIQEPAGYLCSFIGRQSLFIDIMMNVPIIYHAAEQTGDERLRTIADRHVAATAQFLVRPDGSCAHEGLFEPTGQFIGQSTQQGLRADSDWSRGIAWALYGFGTCFHYTNNPAHLATATLIADYWLRQTATKLVPAWDFTADAEAQNPQPFDSSAAAIAASGLWNLSLLTSDSVRSGAYRQHAIRTLAELASPRFLTVDQPEQEGILMHGVYHLHKGLGVDESVIWGDHFFVEGVLKVIDDVETVVI